MPVTSTTMPITSTPAAGESGASDATFFFSIIRNLFVCIVRDLLVLHPSQREMERRIVAQLLACMDDLSAPPPPPPKEGEP
eukprot:9318373-Pyramimonas_sp.AAC.1